MELFQQIWSQALVTVTGAEEEAQRLLSRAQGIVGWSQDEARRLGERLASQRREMERRVEEAVKTSVARLRVPRREEIVQLTTRLEALSKRIEAIQK